MSILLLVLLAAVYWLNAETIDHQLTPLTVFWDNLGFVAPCCSWFGLVVYVQRLRNTAIEYRPQFAHSDEEYLWFITLFNVGAPISVANFAPYMTYTMTGLSDRSRAYALLEEFKVGTCSFAVMVVIMGFAHGLDARVQTNFVMGVVLQSILFIVFFYRIGPDLSGSN